MSTFWGVLICETCVKELPDPHMRAEQVAKVKNRDPVVSEDPEMRPDMQQVIEELEYLNDTLQMVIDLNPNLKLKLHFLNVLSVCNLECSLFRLMSTVLASYFAKCVSTNYHSLTRVTSKWCLEEDPGMRPDMEQVIEKLDKFNTSQLS